MQQLLHSDANSVFEVVYESFQEPIERYLLTKVYEQELAREICQDTFERFWKLLLRKEPASQQIVYYKNWLYRTATNLAIDKLRRKKVIDFVALPEDEMCVSFDALRVEPGEDQTFDRLWLQEALPQLSPQYRNCLGMLLYGYTEKEVAAALGIKEKTVSAHASHGRRELRRRYYPVPVDFHIAEARHADRAMQELLRGVQGVIDGMKLSDTARRAVDWRYRQYMKNHTGELRDSLLVPDPAIQADEVVQSIWTNRAAAVGASVWLTASPDGEVTPIQCVSITANKEIDYLCREPWVTDVELEAIHYEPEDRYSIVYIADIGENV